MASPNMVQMIPISILFLHNRLEFF